MFNRTSRDAKKGHLQKLPGHTVLVTCRGTVLEAQQLRPYTGASEFLQIVLPPVTDSRDAIACVAALRRHAKDVHADGLAIYLDQFDPNADFIHAHLKLFAGAKEIWGNVRDTELWVPA